MKKTVFILLIIALTMGTVLYFLDDLLKLFKD